MFAHIGKKLYLCIEIRKKVKPKTQKAMTYPTKCTFCLTQLLNLKKYSNAKFYFKSRDIYLDIEDVQEHIIIEDLEMYMKAANNALLILTEITEK